MEWIGFLLLLMITVWVYNDAKTRGGSHPILWALGVFCLLIVFLPLYLFMRPAKKSTG